MTTQKILRKFYKEIKPQLTKRGYIVKCNWLSYFLSSNCLDFSVKTDWDKTYITIVQEPHQLTNNPNWCYFIKRKSDSRTNVLNNSIYTGAFRAVNLQAEYLLPLFI